MKQDAKKTGSTAAALTFATVAVMLISVTWLSVPASAQHEEKKPMLQSAPVITFLATKDSDKSKAFFRDKLKLKLVADEPFALVFDSGGTMLRISKVKEITVAPYTVLGWKVKDIVATVKQLAGDGVKFEKFQGFDQDELGIKTFPGGDKVAWFKDPDGNMLSLTQFP